METKLNKDNVTYIVNEYIEENNNQIKYTTERPWDPTDRFEEEYANKQFVIMFNNSYGVSFVTNSFAYGGYEIALMNAHELLVYLTGDDKYFQGDVEGYVDTKEKLYDIFDFVKGLQTEAK